MREKTQKSAKKHPPWLRPCDSIAPVDVATVGARSPVDVATFLATSPLAFGGVVRTLKFHVVRTVSVDARTVSVDATRWPVRFACALY